MRKLVHSLFAASIATTALVCSSGASATVIVGAERLTAIGVESMTSEQSEDGTTTEQTLDSTTVALFGSGRGLFSPLGGALFPRMGVDGVLGPGVTLGGSLMYTRTSIESETSLTIGGVTTKESDELPTISWLLLHPRIGYLASLGDAFYIWPRGGITYSAFSLEAENETIINGVETNQTQEVTYSFVTGTLELMFLASPIEGGAISFGAFADLPLGGETDAEEDPEDPLDPTPEPADLSLLSYGVVAGLALMF